MLRSLPVVLVATLTACGVGTLETGPVDDFNPGDPENPDPGEPGRDPDPEPAPRAYTLSLSQDLDTINLGDQVTLTARIASENFEGDVALELNGALADWDVSFVPSSTVTLAADQTTDVAITIAVPTNGEAASAAALSLNLTGELGPQSASANLTVENQIVVEIVDGAGEGAHGIVGDYPVRRGTSIVILNSDSTSNHRIHADPHQPNSMSQGESYTLVYDSGGEKSAYCHDHDNPSASLMRFLVE